MTKKVLMNWKSAFPGNNRYFETDNKKFVFVLLEQTYRKNTR